jgi:hypothetical protein
MGEHIRGTGKTITCTAMAYINGQMAAAMKGSTSTIRNKDSENTPGRMEGSTRGNGWTASKAGKGSTSFQTTLLDMAFGRMASV